MVWASRGQPRMDSLRCTDCASRATHHASSPERLLRIPSARAPAATGGSAADLSLRDSVVARQLHFLLDLFDVLAARARRMCIGCRKPCIPSARLPRHAALDSSSLDRRSAGRGLQLRTHDSGRTTAFGTGCTQAVLARPARLRPRTRARVLHVGARAHGRPEPSSLASPAPHRPLPAPPVLRARRTSRLRCSDDVKSPYLLLAPVSSPLVAARDRATEH